MLELDQNHFFRVSPVFAKVRCSKPVVFSVIDGNSSDGRVFVDDVNDPKTALIILYDMLFFAGQKSMAFCEQAFDFLEDKVFPNLNEEYFDCYCLSEEMRDDIERVFSSKIQGRPIRITFALDERTFKYHLDWRSKLTSGFEVRLIDTTFIEEYNYDKDFLNPPTNKFGYVLVGDGIIVSECIACFVGGGQVEISVHTNEHYRQKGFALIVCAAFIEYCIARNIIPNWGCWDFRMASIALAKRLGFQERSRDVVYGLKK